MSIRLRRANDDGDMNRGGVDDDDENRQEGFGFVIVKMFNPRRECVLDSLVHVNSDDRCEAVRRWNSRQVGGGGGSGGGGGGEGYSCVPDSNEFEEVLQQFLNFIIQDGNQDQSVIENVDTQSVVRIHLDTGGSNVVSGGGGGGGDASVRSSQSGRGEGRESKKSSRTASQTGDVRESKRGSQTGGGSRQQQSERQSSRSSPSIKGGSAVQTFYPPATGKVATPMLSGEIERQLQLKGDEDVVVGVNTEDLFVPSGDKPPKSDVSGRAGYWTGPIDPDQLTEGLLPAYGAPASERNDPTIEGGVGGEIRTPSPPGYESSRDSVVVKGDQREQTPATGGHGGRLGGGGGRMSGGGGGGGGGGGRMSGGGHGGGGRHGGGGGWHGGGVVVGRGGGGGGRGGVVRDWRGPPIGNGWAGGGLGSRHWRTPRPTTTIVRRPSFRSPRSFVRSPSFRRRWHWTNGRQYGHNGYGFRYNRRGSRLGLWLAASAFLLPWGQFFNAYSDSGLTEADLWEVYNEGLQQGQAM